MRRRTPQRASSAALRDATAPPPTTTAVRPRRFMKIGNWSMTTSIGEEWPPNQ
jgi:hypothetical protein